MSHTGAISGDNDVFDALLDHHGALKVDTLDELFSTATLLASPRKAKRKTAADFYGKGSASASLTQELEAATPCPNVKDEHKVNQVIGGGGAYWVEEMAVKRLKKR